MSNTSIYTNSSSYLLERRRQKRQRVSTLAYLDVGANNGGIVLNFSEEGMAFQAVDRLDNQKAVSLRIQLPRSRTRIETAAQIIWLSESSREAGVRFVDMPSEVLAQIREWIRSQNSVSVLVPQRKQETFREPRKDKWLTLIAKSQAPEPISEIPTTTLESPENSSRTPLNRNDSANFPTLATESGSLGEHANPAHEAIPLTPQNSLSQAIAEPPKSAADVQSNVQSNHDAALALPNHPRVEAESLLVERPPASHVPATAPESGSLGEHANPPDEAIPLTPQNSLSQVVAELPKLAADGQSNVQNNRDASLALPNHPRVEAEGLLDRSPASQAVPQTAPESSTPPAAAEARVSDADSEPIRAAVVASTIPAAPPRGNRTLPQKWAAFAMLFVSISILCFGIGKWIGSRRTRVQSMQTPASLPPALPAAGMSANESNQRDASEPVHPISSKRGVQHNGGKSRQENKEPKQDLLPSSAVFLPLQRTVEPATTPQNPIPPTTTKPSETAPAPAPILDDSSAKPPGPTIVAGRTLRPTDRFNPCHLTYRVEPAYPLEAQQQRVEGTVKIHLLIGPDGLVRGTKLLSGPPLLASAAMDAVKYWHYVPALLNGQPVETEQDIEVAFRLPR